MPLLDWCAIKKVTKGLLGAILILIGALLFFSFANRRAFGQEERTGSAWAPSILEPFWTSNRMTGETVMFVQRPEEQVVTARLTNLAEGGQDSTWAVKMAYKAAAQNPDLVIIGFGGNAMTANPDWPESKATLCQQYRDALFRLAGPGVAVADEFSMWQELVKNKSSSTSRLMVSIIPMILAIGSMRKSFSNFCNS